MTKERPEKEQFSLSIPIPTVIEFILALTGDIPAEQKAFARQLLAQINEKIAEIESERVGGKLDKQAEAELAELKKQWLQIIKNNQLDG